MKIPVFRQYPGCEPKQNEDIDRKPGYQYTYSLRTYILFFFTFSLVGWIWEVGLHLFIDGSFVNRGVMMGPWIPIYGSGGVLIIWLLRRFAEKPVVTFVLATGLCSVVEYVTSFFLEVTKHIRWWDYTGYMCNINGRICLEGAIMFGLGGCAFIYVVAPLIAEFYKKIPIRMQTTICILCILMFSFDLGHSVIRPNMGEGVRYYAQLTDELKHQKMSFDNIMVNLGMKLK